MGNKKTVIPRFEMVWYFLGQHMGFSVVLLLISFLMGIASTLNVSLIYTILNWGLGVDSTKSNILSRFNEFIISKIPISDRFIAACVFFLIASVLFCIFMYLEVLFRSLLIFRIMTTTRIEIFKKFLHADYQYFLDRKQGDLIYRAGEAPTFLITLYFAIASMISDLVLSVSLLAVIFIITPVGTLLLLGGGFLYYIFTQTIGYKLLYSYGNYIKKTNQEYNVLLNESITGIRSIKVNGFLNSWIKEVNAVIKRNFYYYNKSRLWEGLPEVLLRILFYFSLGVAAIVIRLRYPDNFVAMLPAFGTLGFAILNLLPRLSSIGIYRMRVLQSLPNVELVYTTLKENNKEISEGIEEFRELNSNIKFQDVHFSHKGRLELLKGISMSFEKGKMTAIIGKSGSGKSTIVHLLLKLFTPSSGEIIVNSKSFNIYSTSSWLSKVGFVDQDVFIYNTTIKDNILFGQENRKEEDIKNAIRIANAEEFISRLPEGYNTIVGDRGVKLSGGEKQRIAIARAILRNPEIIILDEATASLDNLSEALVQKAIDNISKDHTIIVIAHRLSTIQNADKIIVIDEGRVVEQGRHEELIVNKKFYWALYNKQKQEKNTENRVSEVHS